MQRHVTVGSVTFGNDLPFVLIAGPCQLESREHAFECAAALVEMAAIAGVSLVYKTSFDKANRSSIKSARGIGFARSLDIFADLREKFGVTLLTDVHEDAQCKPAAAVVDILQIPAFLSRQTDLLHAAGSTGAAVNIKKGPFMAPRDIAHAAEKVASAGNDRILLTERGVSFGYHNLVVDMRAIPIMAETGYPIIFDATHSVQQPGSEGMSTGGDRRMAPILARAAVAVGVAGLFVETHPDPDRAPSDGATMLPLRQMPEFIGQMTAFDRLTKMTPRH
jgi:2-dehydro-3-deoxyphosphooctonate aldolase (KDO 8-P synthase)